MNINMMPYHWSRHLPIGFATAAVCAVWWWVFLVFDVSLMPRVGMLIRPQFEGAWLLSGLAAASAFVSIYAEAALRREGIHWRLMWAVPAGLLAWLLTLIWVAICVVVADALQGTAVMGYETLAGDYGVVSIRYRLACWLGTGFIAGLAPVAVRVGRTRSFGMFIVEHLAGGTAAGLVGAAFWQFMAYYGIAWLGVGRDLYQASAFASVAFGWVFGTLCWGVPDSLYRGWIRILSAYRYGFRIPLEKPDAAVGERFVGHYPRGLDVNLPVEKGIAELHVSFSAADSVYVLRGLSQQPTEVKRFLESVDLRYDPRRPAPLETELSHEDVITFGKGSVKTEVEFILLPKDVS
jgi:hypothetical protein